MQLRQFEPSDYRAAFALWQATPGVGLGDDDAEQPISRFLSRNLGLSHVATEEGQMIGTILCGHDGRRALIHHLVVAQSHRRRGIAKQLLNVGLASLRDQGITKAHLLVFKSNPVGLAFWRALNVDERTEIALFSARTQNAV